MDSSKATPQDIYQVLEQQKKLEQMRLKLAGILEKVNQTINSITVENLELTSSQIDSFDDEVEHVDQKAPVIDYDPRQYEKRAEEINQQFMDLEMKFSHFEPESDEEDEEFDF